MYLNVFPMTLGSGGRALKRGMLSLMCRISSPGDAWVKEENSS
jgi:hypothetical protein